VDDHTGVGLDERVCLEDLGWSQQLRSELGIPPTAKYIISCGEHRQRTLRILRQLGLITSPEKTTESVPVLEVTGCVIDCPQLMLRLPEDKRQRLVDAVSEYLDTKLATRQQLDSLVGRMYNAGKAIRPARLFIKNIAQFKDSLLGHSEEQHKLPSEALYELEWWQKLLHEWNGSSVMVSFDYDSRALVTDASPYGGGARWSGEAFGVAWPASVLAEARALGKLSTGFLELYAVLLAAETWSKQWTGLRIAVVTDSITVRNGINNLKAAAKPILELVRRLFLVCVRSQCDLRSFYVPSAANPADALSRLQTKEFFAKYPWLSAVVPKWPAVQL